MAHPPPESPSEPPTPHASAATPSDPSGTDPLGAAPAPVLRASDADRERTADILRHAGSDGRLTVDELEERLHAAYGAVARRDLEPLTADLVADSTHASPHPATGGSAQRVAVRSGDPGAEWVVAVMGGSERKGHWRVGRRCTVVSVMGGADLDLCDAEFAADEVHLRVVSVMGGADIRVPDHMNVRVTNSAFMGGNSVKIGEAMPDPGGPILHLHLISVMGGADVKRGRKRSRAEKRQERRDERERERLDR